MNTEITIQDEEENNQVIILSMKQLIKELNALLQKLRGPIITNITSTKIRTLDSRFIYYHDFIAYRSFWTWRFGRVNRDHDNEIIEKIKQVVTDLNQMQLQLSDGVCVDLDAIVLQSDSMKRIQHYNLTAYYKVIL